MTTNTTTDLYEKALAAEPKLRALDLAVRTMAALVRPGDRMCSGCAWSRIVKPLARPLIGNERGTVPTNAKDRRRGDDGWSMSVIPASLLKGPDMTPADTATERWLRSMEAWDAVTGTWLRLLQAADPTNGHGIGRRGHNLLVHH